MAEYVCEVVTEHELCGDVHHYVRRERVVRCRDCAHNHLAGTCCDRFYDGGWVPVEPDGFCAWASERGVQVRERMEG